MTIELEFLKSLPYFSGLNSAELESVSKLIFEKTAERGEVILFEDEPAETLYFVVSGVVKIYKTSADGKEQILNIIRPGESFNDVPIFDNGPNPATAQAMGPVILYGISKDKLKTTLREYQRIALNTIKVLAERVRQLVALVEDLSFKHVIGRVAKILLEHASDNTGPRSLLTQQEMAAMAGTAREVVARSLKSLSEDGIIRLERHRIIIADREALQEIATSS